MIAQVNQELTIRNRILDDELSKLKERSVTVHNKGVNNVELADFGTAKEFD